MMIAFVPLVVMAVNVERLSASDEETRVMEVQEESRESSSDRVQSYLVCIWLSFSFVSATTVDDSCNGSILVTSGVGGAKALQASANRVSSTGFHRRSKLPRTQALMVSKLDPVSIPSNALGRMMFRGLC